MLKGEKVMKKSGIRYQSVCSLVLVVLLVLVPLFTFAEHAAWDCPNCGRTGNTGNFCGGCGNPSPWNEKSGQPADDAENAKEEETPLIYATPEPSATLNDSVSSFAGQTTISWSAGSNSDGEYKVLIEALNPSGGSKSLLQLAGSTKGTSITTGLLAPEKTYQVTLLNSSYNVLDTHEYTMPSVPTFEDGRLKNTSIKITIEQRSTTLNGKYKKYNPYRASEMESIIAAESAYPCMKFQMQMPQLAYERSFFVQLVYESPNGYTYTDRAQEITFKRVNNGYQTLWWENAGIDFFSDLYSQTGSIPRGEYKVHLYWDGCWIRTSTFQVE